MKAPSFPRGPASSVSPMTTSAQPSPEAVELVAAALRTERALTVYEEYCTRYTRSPVKHAAYVAMNDKATEAVWQYIIALEAKAAAYDALGLIEEAA